MRLWLAGGRQRRAAGVADRDHRGLYDLAVLAALDPATGALETALTWRSPGPCDPDRVGHRFGAPSADGDGLVLCTERDVLRIRDGEVTERWTHPWMADLHHARSVDGRLVAVSTGADGVLGQDGMFRSVVGGSAPSEDLRCVERRDRAHPNHVAVALGRTWVTRGTLGDVLCLEDGRVVPIADVIVHDGWVEGDHAWFTAVDGRLLQVDLALGRVVRTLRLEADGDEPLGWCRGLAVCDGVAWVGFSRLRATRLRRNLAWVRGRLRGRPFATRRPTRVEGYRLADGRRIASFPVAAVGLDALFGVIAGTTP